MPDASNGFITAITGVISGFIVEILLKAFVDGGLISPSIIVIFQLVNILAVFALVHATRYWGTLYLFGWWFGLGIMLYSGLVQSWEFATYSAILVLVLVSRTKRRFD